MKKIRKNSKFEAIIPGATKTIITITKATKTTISLTDGKYNSDMAIDMFLKGIENGMFIKVPTFLDKVVKFIATPFIKIRENNKKLLESGNYSTLGSHFF